MKSPYALIAITMFPLPAVADLVAANACGAALPEVASKIYSRAKAAIPPSVVVTYNLGHGSIERVTGAMWKSGELEFGQGREESEAAEKCILLIGDGQ